jgi:GT2 family glycosyltransferase
MRRGGSQESDAASIATLAREAMRRGLQELADARTSGTGNRSALRWLDRAHRLVPHDPNATLTLASACLADDPARAAALFQAIIDTYDVRQAWLGLAAARLRLSGPEDAAEPLAVLLSRHAFAPDAAGLANAVAPPAGWCTLCSDGRLEIHPAAPKPLVLLDGKPVRGSKLPASWQRARTIDVRTNGVPLLGSPIQVAAIRRLAGCVEACDGGIQGWAWHPGDPDTAPALTVLDCNGTPLKHLIAEDESVAIADTGPLARPRWFTLSRTDLSGSAGPLRIIGPDGKDLPGSPLDPFIDEVSHAAASLRLGRIYPAGSANRQTEISASPAPALRADAPMPPRPVGAAPKPRAVTIVIPVRDGGDAVQACLDSVLASLPKGGRILVVDDGSSDPAVIGTLDALRCRRRVELLRHKTAQGFPAAANAGIQAAAGRDVVLLNSDTLVPPGWLERLRDAAYACDDIGTVTPFSNDASIVSYPGPAGTNKVPDQAETNRLDRAAQHANGGAIIDIPVGVGFCLYLRRDCLDVTGSFRSDRFAQGYGEENDFCLRARHLGWRSVALTGLFVGHRGGASFGGSAAHLRARNSRIVEQLHPGYRSLIDSFIASGSLDDPRRRIDLHRWRETARNKPQSAILITHEDGGGVEQRLLHSIRQHARADRRPIILRPAETASGESALRVQDGEADGLRNLVFAIPRETPALLRLLRATGPEIIEAHHLAAYPPAIYDLIASLRTPHDVHVHDYAWFCPRISLVGAHDRYCGEPDLPECESCIADNGHFLQEDITVAALRRRSAVFLAAARRVVVPSDDTGTRMRRHFDGLETKTVPHEDDSRVADAPAPAMSLAPDTIAASRSHITTSVGGINHADTSGGEINRFGNFIVARGRPAAAAHRAGCK